MCFHLSLAGDPVVQIAAMNPIELWEKDVM